MKGYFFLLTLVLYSQLAYCQNPKTDSLLLSMNEHLKRGKLNEAYEIGKLYADEIAKYYGKESIENAETLNNIGLIKLNLGNFKDSENLFYESLSIYEIKNQKKDYGFGHLLNNIGLLHAYQGKYETAVPFILESIEIIEYYLGNKNIDYLVRLNNIAEIYRITGDLEKSLNVLLKCHNVFITEGLDKNHELFATLLNNLGLAYNDIFDYEKAEQFFLDCKYLEEKKENTNSINYYKVLSNLATLYQQYGASPKALFLYKKCLKILEVIGGKTHPDYAIILGNLSVLYEDIGEKEKSFEYLNITKEIQLKTLGNIHPDYAKTLNHIANKLSTQNYDVAQEMYEESRNIIKINFGDRDIRYAEALGNLGKIKYFKGDFRGAIKLLEETKFLIENGIGKLNPSYITTIQMLGLCYANMSDSDQAILYFKEAVHISSKKFGNNSKSLFDVYFDLGNFYYRESKYDSAFVYFNRAIEMKKLTLDKYFPDFTEQQKEKYLGNLAPYIIYLRNIFFSIAGFNENISKNYYDNELYMKNIILRQSINFKKIIESQGDSSLLALYNNYQFLKKTIAFQSARFNIKGQDSIIQSLQIRVNDLESEIIRFSNSYKNDTRDNIKNWIDIRNKLQSNQVAIEFSSFRYRTSDAWTDSIFYVALVLRPNDTLPKMIKLFEQKQLDSLLAKTYDRESVNINNFYSKKRLYKLIWEPIEKFVNNADQIYFSPTGSLHQINLDAIAINDSMYLSDLYSFYRVGSTATLASDYSTDKNIKDIAIFGGIDFDAKDEEISSVLNDIRINDEIVTRSNIQDSTRGGKWTYLNGTLDEAKMIHKIAENMSITSYLFTGVQAVEEKFKGLRGKNAPSILHIATHGYFIPDPKLNNKQFELKSFKQENAFTVSDNPMNRSGLLLAGGNKSWVVDSLTIDREDGILTAFEVSHTNLFNTELVVLSACETGLGDIKGSEGVYGLQRAFKMAGARYLMMSLWKVPDNATKEFMTTFYTEYLTNQKPVREAFTITQTKMKDKYRNEPYKWGGFVLME